MARTNGPIQVWHRGDTIPTDPEGGYAGGDSTAAAVGGAMAQAGQAVATVDNLTATATALPPGATPTVTVSGSVPNKVINIGIPRGADGAPGMGYEEGQQLLAQNQATLDAAEAAQTAATSSASDASASAASAATAAEDAAGPAATAAAEAIRSNLVADLSTPGNPAYEALVDAAGDISEASISTVVGRLFVDATAHGVPNDGTTGAGAPLNALIQDVSAAGGGVIVLPNGTYIASGGITGAANVTVRGATRDGVVIRKTGGSNSAWIATGASTGFRIENLTIDGSNLVTTRGVTFSAGSTGCAITGCVVKNFGGAPGRVAIDTLNAASGITIADNVITDSTIGVRLQQSARNVTVARNTFTQWSDSAVYINGDATNACTDITIEGNIVGRHIVDTANVYVRQPIRSHGDDTNPHRNITIRGNVVTGAGTNHADTLDPGTADLISLHRCVGFEVSGNTVRSGGDVGITISQGCSDGRIIGNLCEDNDSPGINLGSPSSSTKPSRLTVSGNVLRNNARDRADTGGTTITRLVERAKANLVCTSVADSVVEENVLTFDPGHATTPRYAITFQDCTNVHIGAVGTSNKATGHTANYFSDAARGPNTGMTTNLQMGLTSSGPGALAVPSLTVNGAPIYSGAGDPEGVVHANVGAFYIRTGDMGFSTEFRLYAKDLGTGTTGWRSVNFTRAVGNASLNSATNGINTVGKRPGSVAFNTSAGKPVWATGTDPTSTWVDATGTVVNTPS